MSRATQGISEGLLPGLSKVADAEKEGGLLPKQSDFVIKEEPATSQVLFSLDLLDLMHFQAGRGLPSPHEVSKSKDHCLPFSEIFIRGFGQRSKQTLLHFRPSTCNEDFALQEIEDLQTSVVDVRRPSGLPPIRRSQKPVTKVAGQLRLVAGGACIPAPAKVQNLLSWASPYPSGRLKSVISKLPE